MRGSRAPRCVRSVRSVHSSFSRAHSTHSYNNELLELIKKNDTLAVLSKLTGTYTKTSPTKGRFDVEDDGGAETPVPADEELWPGMDLGRSQVKSSQLLAHTTQPPAVHTYTPGGTMGWPPTRRRSPRSRWPRQAAGSR